MKSLRLKIKILLFMFLSKLPKKNYIFFESHRGLNCQCNPKAIFDNLKINENIKYIWSSSKESNSPINSVSVKRGSIFYIYYLLRSKVWVQNGEFPKSLVNFKTKETLYINTQHGVPLKKMGNDINYLIKKNYEERNWDILLTQNRYMTKVFKKSFCLKNDIRILENYYPRNDIFYQNVNIENIKLKLGLPLDKKIILYAPTYREYHKKFYYLRFFENLNKIDFEGVVFISRGHHLNLKHDFKPQIKLYDFSDANYDPQELCLASDILITDYSSIMFDFLHLKKPIIHYFIDYDLYDDYRGLYFNLKDENFGPVINSSKELVDILNDLKDYDKNLIFKEKIDLAYEKFCKEHNFESSKNVASIIEDYIEKIEKEEDKLLDFLFILKKIRQSYIDWKKHSMMNVILKQPNNIKFIFKNIKDFNSYPYLNKVFSIKNKVLILGNADNLNLMSQEDIDELKKDHVVIGLNRTCMKFDVDITLWADNQAIIDILNSKSINKSKKYIQVSCNSFNRKKYGSMYWSENRNFKNWDKKYIFMSRTILTAALYICYKFKIYDIKFLGIDLETRNYFLENHILLNKQISYEKIDSYYINRDHCGYTTQKIVQEILEYMSKNGFNITSYASNEYLKNINGLKIDKYFINKDLNQ